jgi:hypothetical protein
MAGQVFISYSRKDDAVMRRIVGYLRKRGIIVWVDNEKLVPGTPIWEVEIEKAIRRAGAIVVLLSPDSNISPWVRREISYAEDNGKRIFPILIAGDERSTVPIRLTTHQRIDIRQNEATGLNALSAALSFYLEDLAVREQRTKEEAERLAREKAAREKAEREIAEKTAKETAKREAAEIAEREKAERELAEKVAREKAEREAAKKARREATKKKVNEQAARLKAGIEARRKALLEAAENVKHNVVESFRKIPTQIYKGFFVIAIFLVVGYSGSRWYSAVQIASVTSTAIANATSTERANITSTARANAASTERANITSTAWANTTATAIAKATSTAKADATSTAIAEANAQATANAKATRTARAKANAQATQAAKYFFDDFNDNSNKWNTDLTTGFNGDEKVYSSFISISDGVYIWDVTEVNTKVVALQAIPDKKSVEDFLLSVDAKNESDYPDLCYGLYFRAKEFYFYKFTVCDSQRYKIIVNDSNEWGRTLSGWTNSSAIKPDDWNQLKVIASGSQFEFYINDVQVEQIRDPALTSGTLGILFEAEKGKSGQIWFDNFQYEIR